MAELDINIDELPFGVGDKVYLLPEETIVKNTELYRFDRLSQESYGKFRHDAFLEVVGISKRKLKADLSIIDVNVKQSNGNKTSLYYPLELEVYHPYSVDLI